MTFEFSHQIKKKECISYTWIMIPTKLHVSALNCETLVNCVRMGIFVRVSLQCFKSLVHAEERTLLLRWGVLINIEPGIKLHKDL